MKKSENNDDKIIKLRNSIDDATNTETTTTIRKAIEELKSAIGITAYTELKNKVIKRHRNLQTNECIHKAINGLSPDLDNAASEFASVENLLRTSERDLTPNEIEGYQTILADMRPEYVTQ